MTRGTVKRLFAGVFGITLLAIGGEGPVDRWAVALGGREKLASIKSIYREATLEYGPYQGTIKVFHTFDGKYRKEEKVASFSTVEVFDGVVGTVQQGSAAARRMSEPELQTAMSRRFANANALFFVFFPERRRGTLTIENDGTILLKPEGGIDWRVALDPEKNLPKTMVHKEGDQTITVSFVAYEPVDGILFEKEIHRSAGDSGPGAVIRFIKTVLNPPIEESLFSTEIKNGAASASGGDGLPGGAGKK